MKKIILSLSGMLLVLNSFGQNINQIKEKEVGRVIKTLASDEMQGRATFSPGIEKAAKFIENEFKKIGLTPLPTEKGFRQSFSISRFKPGTIYVSLNGQAIPTEKVMASTDQAELNWNEASGIEQLKIEAGATFINRYREILRANKSAVVWVDPQYADAFKRIREAGLRQRPVVKPRANSVVFILSEKPASTTSA